MQREGTRHVAWMLAELETPEALVAAVRALHAMGMRRVDAYTPYPIEDVDRALGLPRSKIPRWVLAGGVLGALLGFGIQAWLDAVDYPLNVGARPLLSAPAFIPITFESTVLVASVTAFVAFFAEAGLPRLAHPLFEVEGFERASIDRFWLSIETSDPRYDAASAKKAPDDHGALRVLVKEGVL
jgi:hypothetical protein